MTMFGFSVDVAVCRQANKPRYNTIYTG